MDTDETTPPPHSTNHTSTQHSAGDIVFLSAHELAAKIRARKLSSVQIFRAHLTHIRLHNPSLNAVVTLDEERALVRAEAADRALATGEIWGALHGVPVTIKDAFETEGLRTTFGYRFTSHYVPSRNATVVERLVNAGAIVLGKTNIPEVSWDWQTKSPIFGRTNNPWNTECTPGGSTGGGAAAVASGMSPLEIGSDGAGSIRVPAHFCGVFGLKPTGHLVSGAGHMEIPRGVERGHSALSGFGPLARSVADLRLALSIIAGSDERHWDVPPVSLDAQKDSLKNLGERRFAWTGDFGGVPVTKETSRALFLLSEQLKERGCHVERTHPPSFDFAGALETCGELWGAESAADMILPLRLATQAAYMPLFGRGPWTRGFVRGLGFNARGYSQALRRRDQFILSFDKFLSNWDAWLCPVASVPAFTHRRTGKRIAVNAAKIPYSQACGTFASIFNMTEHPVVVIPLAQTQEGLPIGMQLVGARWGDTELLSVAEQLTQLTGSFKRPPGY